MFRFLFLLGLQVLVLQDRRRGGRALEGGRRREIGEDGGGK